MIYYVFVKRKMQLKGKKTFHIKSTKKLYFLIYESANKVIIIQISYFISVFLDGASVSKYVSETILLKKVFSFR